MIFVPTKRINSVLCKHHVLLEKLAVRLQFARRAVGFSRMAYISAVEYQIVMQFAPKIFVKRRHQLFFRFFGGVCVNKSYSVRHSENVGVYRDGVAAVGHGINYVCGLSANAAQFHKFVARFGHFPHIEHALRHFLYGFCLVVVETTGENTSFKLFRRHINKILRRRRNLEKFRRHGVYAFVGALRGKNDRDKQFERRAEVEFALSVGVHFSEQIVNFFEEFFHPLIIAQKADIGNLFRQERRRSD